MLTDFDVWPLYEFQSLVISDTAFSLRSPGSGHQWVQRSQRWQRAPHCESVAHLTKTTAADLLTNFQEQNWGSGLGLWKQRRGHQMTFGITLSFHPFQMRWGGMLPQPGLERPTLFFLQWNHVWHWQKQIICSSLYFTSPFAKFMKLPFQRLKGENDLELILWLKMKWTSHSPSFLDIVCLRIQTNHNAYYTACPPTTINRENQSQCLFSWTFLKDQGSFKDLERFNGQDCAERATDVI